MYYDRTPQAISPLALGQSADHDQGLGGSKRAGSNSDVQSDNMLHYGSGTCPVNGSGPDRSSVSINCSYCALLS